MVYVAIIAAAHIMHYVIYSLSQVMHHLYGNFGLARYPHNPVAFY